MKKANPQILLDPYWRKNFIVSMKEAPPKSKFVRVWQRLPVEEVRKKLLYVDDLYGTCGNCKKLGLNYLKDRICPACKTEFRYITVNSKNPADVTKILSRLEKESIPLIMIDRDDFEKSSAKDAAEELFKKTD